MISRRLFLSSATLAVLSGCTSIGSRTQPISTPAIKPKPQSMPAIYGAIADEPYPIDAVPRAVSYTHLTLPTNREV